MKIRKFLLSRTLQFSFTLVFAASLGIFFRLYPLIQHGRPYVIKLATVVVQAHIKQQVYQYVQSNFAHLSEAEKARMLKKNYAVLLAKNSKEINKMIEEGAAELLGKGLNASSSLLLEADSYHFYGLTENIKETGRLSSKMAHGKYFNHLMLAPEGRWEPLSLHPYLGFYLYKIIHFFSREVSLIEAVKFLVIVLSAICLAPFLLTGYRLNVAGLPLFTASIFFILSPFMAQRTAYGWYDTDVYNLLFPLGILLVLFSGIKNIKEIRKNIGYAIAASFLTGLYELFWHGWTFIPVVMAFTLVFGLILDKWLNNFRNAKSILAFHLTYISLTIFWVAVLVSPETLVFTIKEGWKMLNSFLSAKFDLWPNIFLTVGETQPMTIAKTSILLGGNPYFIYLAPLGCLFSLWVSIRKRDISMLLINIFLAIFLASFLYLSLKAVRFTVLLTVPIMLSFALLLKHLYSAADLKIWSKLQVKAGPVKKIPAIVKIAMIIILLAVNAVPINAAYQVCSRIHPIYNQTWDKTMREIKNQTPADSIVNSWWCPGHFISGVAKRRVTVDGATQHEAQTYWIAKILLSQDEKTAIGLLRMLNTSGNKTLAYLENDRGMVTSDAIKLIETLAPLSQNEARLILLSGRFNSEHTEKILSLMYGYRSPAPSYFMVYNELIDAYATLPYIGNWDFKKAEYLALNALIAQKTESEVKYAIPARNSAGFMDFIMSMSGGIPECSPQYSQIFRDGNLVKFENGLVVDLGTKNSFLLSKDAKKFIRPKSLFFVENYELKEKKYGADTLPYSVLLAERNNTYLCLLLDESLANSLLFKLYYLNGKGLTHFKPFLYNEDSATNTTIIVYKIEW